MLKLAYIYIYIKFFLLKMKFFLKDSPIKKTHHEIFQIGRNNICSHLTPLNYITAILGVSAHGSGPSALVIAAIDLFRREG